MVRKILYAHGGSENHGCEAIVRSLSALIGGNKNNLLISNHPEEDILYGIDNLLTIMKSQTAVNTGLLYQICCKFHKDKDLFYYKKLYSRISDTAQKGDVALSIGGDNYCYSGMMTEITAMRQVFAKKGIDTILVGCSVDTSRLSDTILQDIKKYKVIWARESLTYGSLISLGFNNVVLMPDPAFSLSRRIVQLPAGFAEGNTIGINVSPMIIGYEKATGVTLKNYVQLIRYIIEKTDMQVALIPHVVWSHNDDRKPLLALYEQFKDTDRVVLFDVDAKLNAEELKYIISKCRFLVAARTHASIAAYSTLVPTLVVGYSVKARGIARDIFGSEENYVLPVQSMTHPEELTNAFIWLREHENAIRNHYQSFMSEYVSRIDVNRILND